MVRALLTRLTTGATASPTLTHKAVRASTVLAAALALFATPATLAHADPRGPTAGPSQAEDGPCRDDDGVTVIVDFGNLGDTLARCVEGPQSSALTALTSAGFTVQGTARDVSRVCRVDGKPEAEAESCAVPYPTSQGWTFWSASEGGTWLRSGRLDHTHHPVRSGAFVGWAFRTGTRTPTAPDMSPKREAPEEKPKEDREEKGDRSHRTPARSSSPTPAPSGGDEVGQEQVVPQESSSPSSKAAAKPPRDVDWTGGERLSNEAPPGISLTTLAAGMSVLLLFLVGLTHLWRRRTRKR
ncbi:hypothetical protein [Streptomyces sp. NPDC005438]|uniref:hypothetical protein n=1 Tax=Streptomyces sp. NPDC005438 TaxID=3156880 RepID=UPI0033B16DB0